MFVGSYFRNRIISTVPSYYPLLVTYLVSLGIQMNLIEYSLDRSKGHFDLKKGRDKVTFKAESSEQLSKWIAQLQSTLLEAKGEGDQVSVQGTEGEEGAANTKTHRDALAQDSCETGVLLQLMTVAHYYTRVKCLLMWEKHSYLMV